MIIDLILDRKDGKPYNAKDFYNRLGDYGDVAISQAMDGGANADIQRELSRYILDNDYNADIINYIQSQDWLGGEL